MGYALSRNSATRLRKPKPSQHYIYVQDAGEAPAKLVFFFFIVNVTLLILLKILVEGFKSVTFSPPFFFRPFPNSGLILYLQQS